MRRKIEKCPRCEDKAYERFSTFSICHSCNFNTVEDLSWKKFRFRPQPFAGTERDPLIGMDQKIKDWVSRRAFGADTEMNFWKVYKNLSWMQTNALYLQLVRGMDPMTISFFLSIDQRTARSYLNDAINRFKYLGIELSPKEKVKTE